jgi:hypothetical protein
MLSWAQDVTRGSGDHDLLGGRAGAWGRGPGPIGKEGKGQEALQ